MQLLDFDVLKCYAEVVDFNYLSTA